MNHLPLIEKIHLLESQIKDKRFELLEPFSFDPADPIKVQEAAKKIQQHLNLPPLTFIISYSKQKANVGGHIQIDSLNEVFIEIDSEMKKDCDLVLAILAHEICHKFLHLHDIKLFPELENEMLTDATTIYTGLGKLSLNGCEKTSYDQSYRGITTTTQKVGYMNREQFAYVYNLVCFMRNVDEKKILSGLSNDASAEVLQSKRLNAVFFNQHFFNPDLLTEKIEDSLKNRIGSSQKNIAFLSTNLRKLEEGVLPQINLLIANFHSATKGRFDKITNRSKISISKPSYFYINTVLGLEELKLYEAKISEHEQTLRKLQATLENIISQLHSLETIDMLQQDYLFVFDCPSCKNKMRIGERKTARVKCKSCHYSFIVDTGTASGSNLKKDSKKGPGIWGKLKLLFAKKNNNLI